MTEQRELRVLGLLERIATAMERQAAASERLADIAERDPLNALNAILEADMPAPPTPPPPGPDVLPADDWRMQ